MADDVRTAFADLYTTYHRRLRGFAVAVLDAPDADDLVQDAMLRAYASFGTLDRTRDPWPWLVAILRNVARDRWASRGAVLVESPPGAEDDATADVDEREVVRAALGRLSSSDRDVLVLRECHDLSFGELASLLGRSPNALRQQVFRARRRLADAYTAIGGRAVGIACWLRRMPAEPVAAAVVAGVLAVNGPAPAPPPRPPAVTEVAAGPVPRMGTRPGPAAVRTARDRPLPPAPAAHVTAPLATAERPAPPARTTSRKGISRDGRGVSQERQNSGEPVLCAVTEVC